jgi:hypothetical protein
MLDSSSAAVFSRNAKDPETEKVNEECAVRMLLLHKKMLLHIEKIESKPQMNKQVEFKYLVHYLSPMKANGRLEK